MHAVGLAFAWDFWSRHRLVLSLSVAYLLALVLLVAAWPADRLDPETVVPLTTPLWAMLPMLLALFSHGDQGDVVGRDSGYPRRLFTLPVRTAALVGWPLGLGTAAVVLFCLVLTGLVLRPVGVPMPAPWMLVFLAALLAWLQALVWSPFPLPFLRIFTTVLVLGGMLTGALLGYEFGVPPAVLLAVSAVLVPLGYLLAVAGVARARRGDVPAWKWPAAGRVAGTDEGSPGHVPGLPSSAPATPFPSAAAALFWLNSRRSVFVLPLMVGLVSLPLLLMWFCITDPEKALPVLGIMSLYPLGFAAVAGAALGNCHPEARKTTAIPAFVAARPVTSAEMIAVKLRVAVRITLVTWVMIFLILLALVPFSQAGAIVVRLTRRLLDVQGVKGGALLAVFVLGLPALTWKGIVNQLWMSLTGRRWVAVTTGLVFPVGLTALSLFGVYLYFHPQVQDALLVAAPWVAGLLVLLKLAAGVLVARALLRRGLVRSRTVRRFAAAWLAGAAVLFGLAFWLVPADVCAPLLAGCVAVLLGLPLVRLGLALLALDWNRHR